MNNAGIKPMRHDEIVLTDRDFLLFEELMTRVVEPNALVRAEVEEFNRGRFDEQGRYHSADSPEDVS